MDLFNELENLTKQLSNSLKQLRTNGIKLAEAEKEYKIAVNKKALELRSNDTPVTLINQIIYGYEDIAELRFLRDSAEVVYGANKEAINTLKLQIRIVQNQLDKEWNNAGKDY
jgi:hypothetical protein